MNRGTLASLVRGETPAWERVGCDPSAFLDACRVEEVSGLIYHQVRNRPEFAAWPEAVRETLGDDARAAVAREMLAQRELARVLDALGEQGVHPILFKGSALAYTRYPHPSLRPRCDTDLLIPADAMGPVRATMTALGYLPPVQCDGELLFRQFEFRRADQFGVSHAFDFHWAISTQAIFADLLTYDEIHRHCMAVPALGANARAPGTVDALLLALIHPVMHHRNEQRLLWVYDVHLLASALDGAGFDELTARAVSKGIAAVCAHGLGAAREWFGTAVPQPVLDALAKVPLSRQPTADYLAPGRTWADETAASLRGLTRWRDRVRLLREIALPSPGYVLRAYGLNGSGAGMALLPALYLHRGVRGVWRAMNGRK